MPAFLGYVFWHWPRSGIARSRYERELVAFQDSLRAHGSPGLVDLLSFRVQAVAWAKPRSGVYEDWYLVSDFEALGALNDTAAVGPNKSPHADVAKDSSAGAGGVYKQLRGGLSLRDAQFATWVNKPAGTTYRAFLEGLSESLAGGKTDLWQRQMVLGPAPEFCIHGDSRPELPEELRPETVQVSVVGGRGGEP